MKLRALISRIRIFPGYEHAPKDCVEFAAHLAQCPECTRVVEAQTEVRLSLRDLRDAAPTITPALDSAILSNFRRQMAQKSAPKIEPQSRLLFLIPAIGAAVVALVLTTLFVRPTFRPTPKTRPPVQALRPASVAPLLAKAEPPQPTTVRRIARRPTRQQKAMPMGAATSHPRREDLAVSPIMAIPASFSSLMYCDELSCNGEMDRIRVRLPASPRMTTAASTMPPGGAVYAEVLVGPDGVARGIRILH